MSTYDPADGPEPRPQGQDASLDSVRTGHWWQAFTGLVPVVLMVPILLMHAYLAGVLVAVAGSALVIGYHLFRRQGVTSLDLLAVGFGCANLVLYVGFGSTLLIEHLDAVFYSLLLAQSAVSLVRGRPWTTQFTRRTVVPQMWGSEAFASMNVLTTRLWVACFLLCDVAALTLGDPLRVWAPIAVMAVTVVLSRRLGRRHLALRLAA